MKGSTAWRSVSPYLTVEAIKTRLSSNAVKRSETLFVQPANQLQTTLEHLRLFRTPELKTGDVVPPIYHFLYFLPKLTEDQLSSDGGDPTFNAGGSFVRRMWAGGHFKWEPSNPLRFGQLVTETTSLDSATAKITKSGQPMIVVSAKKEYHNEAGLALTENRQWLFREAAKEDQAAQPVKPSNTEQVAGKPIGDITASEVLLFRFSALTFNAHRIHYDKEHTIHKEGHPDVVVHAPLNVLLLANAFHQSNGSGPLTGMTYRAQSPVYARQSYRLLLDGSTMRAVHQDTQQIIMSASMS